MGCRFRGFDQQAAQTLRLQPRIDRQHAKISSPRALIGDLDATDQLLARLGEQHALPVVSEHGGERLGVGALAVEQVGLVRPSGTRALSTIGPVNEVEQGGYVGRGRRADRRMHAPLMRARDAGASTMFNVRRHG